MGFLFLVLCAATLFAVSEAIFRRIGNHVAAGYMWLVLLFQIMLLGQLGCVSIPQSLKSLAKDIFWILGKMNWTGKYKAVHTRYGWVTMVSLLLMGCLSIFMIDYYAGLFAEVS